MFEVRFARHCANGHPLSKGDYAAYDVNKPGVLLCPKCPDFTIRFRKSKEIITSKRFCPKCFLELPIAAVKECHYCEAKL
jgi:hypothetical protein